MKLDGSYVELGDKVFDISSSRGNGKVVAKYENSFEVLFDTGRKVVYNYQGTQRNGKFKTLFWHRPFILTPKKDEHEWVVRQNLLNSLIELIDNYRSKFGS